MGSLLFFLEMKKVILSDLHARLDKTREALDETGAITIRSGDPMTDVRNHDVHVIQIGDAVSLGYDEKEADFYRWWTEVAQPDEELLGNHEAPAVHYDPWPLDFDGYWSRAEMEAKYATAEWMPAELRDYKYEIGRDLEATAMVQRRFREGKYKIATSVGEWLVTHAGVSPRYQKMHHYKGVPVAEIAADLNGRFERCQRLHTPDDVITHTGENRGGILWLRFNYLKMNYKVEHHIPQIVGHSSLNGPDLTRKNLWCIDNKAGVYALVTEDEGKTFESVFIP